MRRALADWQCGGPAWRGSIVHHCRVQLLRHLRLHLALVRLLPLLLLLRVRRRLLCVPRLCLPTHHLTLLHCAVSWHRVLPP